MRSTHGARGGGGGGGGGEKEEEGVVVLVSVSFFSSTLPSLGSRSSPPPPPCPVRTAHCLCTGQKTESCLYPNFCPVHTHSSNFFLFSLKELFSFLEGKTLGSTFGVILAHCPPIFPHGRRCRNGRTCGQGHRELFSLKFWMMRTSRTSETFFQCELSSNSRTAKPGSKTNQ